MYSNAVYSGLLGKAIGVRLGAPIEPYQWTYQRINDYYGDIRSYVKDSWKFAADDDTNGPLFFIRALLDHDISQFSASTVGKAWLDYARDGQGMFWWGGVGVSTEHTAYENLKNGIEAPESGSSKLNTTVLSEQVGGQIFIDSWALIFLDDVDKAMEYARIAASVSHDGQAQVGAMFIAGCIAYSYKEKNIENVVSYVLSKLDETSEYVTVLRDIHNFYKNNPNDFRFAYEYVTHHYSYDHYEGMCHIIPNACLVLIGLLYGEGDFARSIEITCMCGWDTDSNAGVVGTIMGVLNGLPGIPEHYRQPINDTVIASSMSPTLNVVNLSQFALQLTEIHDALQQNRSPKDIKRSGDLHCTFPFLGSSEGLQIHNQFRLIRDKQTQQSLGKMDLLIDNLVEGDTACVYLQTMYRMKDFPDNRYDPVMSPLVYSGQTLRFVVSVSIDFIDALEISLYLKTVKGRHYTLVPNQRLMHMEVVSLEAVLPDTHGDGIAEVGVMIQTQSKGIDGNGLLGRFRIHEVFCGGPAKYTIDAKSQEPMFLNNITPFSNHRIKTTLDDSIHFIANDVDGISICGNYYGRDVELETKILDYDSGDLILPFRLKGLENYYLIRISGKQLTVEHRYYLKTYVLASKTLNDELDNSFDVNLTVNQTEVSLSLNKDVVLTYNGIQNNFGHFGFGGKNTSYAIQSVRIINS